VAEVAVVSYAAPELMSATFLPDLLWVLAKLIREILLRQEWFDHRKHQVCFGYFTYLSLQLFFDLSLGTLNRYHPS
jgi:hypothetical protein